MSVSSSISALQRTNEAHSITAAFDGSSIQTTRVTGDREGGLFRQIDDQMGKMSFLQLLTTQLQYQDPLSPMENTDFVAQLAQFSQLESTTSMEAAMTRMAQTFEASMDLQNFNAQSTTNAASVSLVGKQVRLRQNIFEYNGGNQVMDFRAHLGDTRERAVVNIVDGDGKVIRSIELSDKDDNNVVHFTWDGRDETGQRVPADTYNLIIEGQERDDNLYCFVEDVVAGIRYTNQGTMVIVRGVEIPVSNILEVRHTGTSSGNSGGGMNTSDLSMAQALGMIGHDVKAKLEERLTYEPSPNQRLQFNLDLGGTPNATLVIRDKNGVEVHRIEVDEKALRDYANANDVPFGTFSIPKTAHNNTGEFSVQIIESNRMAYFYKRGSITGVVNQNGTPRLRMDGMFVDISEIIEISKAA